MIHKIKPDCILSYTIKPVIYGTLAAWLVKVPKRFALVTGLGYAFQNVDKDSPRSIFQKLVHGLYQQELSHCSKTFFQNPDDLALFRALKLLQSNIPAVVVNGSGVNVSDFDVMPLPLNGQNQVAISFLLIARLLGDKGVREYAKAAAIIKKNHPDIQFNLVGWIDDNPAAITQLELDAWVNA